MRMNDLNPDIGTPRSVHVSTSARLHMGFFDLHGGLGRQYGSIGVGIDQPVTELRAWRAEELSVEGPGADRAVQIINGLARALKIEQGMHMELLQVIPEHAGLGAGTQLSLAVGLVMSRLFNLRLTAKEIAALTERGARSGIGVGTFMHGGVIVDGGRGPQAGVPPVIARAEFPEAWRIILAFDKESAGVHGKAEIEAFRTLPRFPAADAAVLCRHVLMQALPALAEQDLAAFGAAIRILQEKTGDHFAPVQGGRYASAKIAAVMAWLDGQNVSCFGQSSWGPTGFAVFENEQQANDYLLKLQSEYPAVEFMLCKGSNESSVIQDISNREMRKV